METNTDTEDWVMAASGESGWGTDKKAEVIMGR